MNSITLFIQEDIRNLRENPKFVSILTDFMRQGPLQTLQSQENPQRHTRKTGAFWTG